MHEHDERLAAYAAGELDADAAAALEVELARDPVLRARLAKIRRLDEALESLPDVEPPRGFESRLRAALRGPVTEQLEDTRPGEVAPLPVRRRLADRLPEWLPALAGAAAGVALLGGLGYGVLQAGGGDMAQTAGGDAVGETAEDLTLERAPESAAPVDGPLVLATGRAYDEAGLGELARDPVVDAGADRELTKDPPEVVARRYAAQLGIAPMSATASSDTPEASAPARDEDAQPDAGTRPALRAPGVSDAELADVRRCVTTVHDEAGDDGAALAIPTYAELATFEGEPVVVVGLVTPGPAGDTRNEVWVLDRADCQVRYFTQSE